MSDTVFSSVAREYASFRPGYPAGLFDWLARACARHETAWDCGCGSGQASVALAAHFRIVHATDLSRDQIAAAKPHPRVEYSVASAERSGLADASMDLVTVAQALHWFDVSAFYEEARRVARPDALIAVWTYPRPEFADPALDNVFFEFYSQVVGPYWPPERRHVESHYRSLPFPFEEMEHPAFALDLDWSLEQVIGYVGSWSATANYRSTVQQDPLSGLRGSLRAVWPESCETQRLRMPLVLRVAALRGG